MTSFTGRKATRGNASVFKKLDEEIRWLNYDLSMMVIRDDRDKVNLIKQEIEIKLAEIKLVSTQIKE